MKKLTQYLSVFIFLLAANALWADEQDLSNPNASPDVSANVPDNWQHVLVLVETIQSTQENLKHFREELQRIETPRERDRLKEEIEILTQDLQSLNTALEMLATGGADLTLFGVKTETKFDWREELQSVFEPLLVALRRASERPRKIERLRGELAFYQQRLIIADDALASLKNYVNTAPNKDLHQAIEPLEKRWLRRRDNLRNRVNLTNIELQELLSPDKSQSEENITALKELLSGRLLNLFIGVLVMLGTYLLISYISRSYRNFIMKRPSRRKAMASRVGSLMFYLLSSLIVLLSGFAVFYIQGDWVLLGLFIIILVGAAWALQKSLPRYVTEAKLILNLGPIREGERLIYNGLPWLIRSLNFYATLNNPLLQGGSVRVPIRELVSSVSRKFDENEPWFPSAQGDWVLLDDGVYGCVEIQTPELVELRVLGARKVYQIANYIASNPRNLSRTGFIIALEFGLDYQHQSAITTSILSDIHDYLNQRIQDSPYLAHLISLQVEFSKANASSLDILVKGTFLGSAAGDYYIIQRFLQACLVDACNKFGWTIPFNQIVVHNADKSET